MSRALSNSAFRCNIKSVCQYCKARNGIASLGSGSTIVLLKVLKILSVLRGQTCSRLTKRKVEAIVSS
jgi:hypothetical protein